MSQDGKFCSKCGAGLVPGSAFCSSCGSPISVGPAAAAATTTYQAPPAVARRRDEKGEKNEKQEKREKQEKHEKGRGGDIRGALIGGGILIWLGTLVYLENVGSITGADLGGYFLLGLGALLIIGGVLSASQTGRPWTGMIIGGVVLMLLGFAAIPTVRDQLALTGLGAAVGPLVLVFFGLLIIFAAVSARRRSPRP